LKKKASAGAHELMGYKVFIVESLKPCSGSGAGTGEPRAWASIDPSEDEEAAWGVI